MRIVIEIDELVLHGFPAGERYAVADALRNELTRLVDVHALHDIPSGVRLDRLSGAFTLDRGAQPQAVGASVARSLHGSLMDGIAGSRPRLKGQGE